MTPRKPQWWQLYLMGGVMGGLLLWAHFAFAEDAARHIMQIGIILIGYGLILAWFGSQARAIEREEQARRDAALDCDLPITKQQVVYRLALSRRDARLRGREK